jgi:tetratricopeptide (TPR) repeat protein
MAATPEIAEAFRLLEAGRAAAALEVSRRVAQVKPREPKARLAEGIALRMLGRHGEALAALEQGARIDPADHALAYEAGVVHQIEGRAGPALACFDRARSLRPGFFAAHFAAGAARLDRGAWNEAAECFRAVIDLRPGDANALLHLAWALQRAGRHAEAEQAYVRALYADPHRFETLKTFGQYSASRGRFDRAAKLFSDALREAPEDGVMAMFVAQAELLQGRWAEAWAAYRHREPRRELEATLAAAGSRYRVPALGELRGRDVTLVGEQGVGDALFFLRWAPLLRDAGARLHFAGHPRLHPLLQRTALFDSLRERFEPARGSSVPVLLGDLPALARPEDPLTVPSLRIAPEPSRVAAWRRTLESAGPRPWIGVTWRAGTSPEVVAHALYKAVPLERLLAALQPFRGTLVAMQRGATPAELDAARAAISAPLHHPGAGCDDLEDALAIVSLLDRHAGVSSTNMHLAALAGRSADVLQPFPPEWRWRAAGDSPWFPGFRVHRQDADGDWEPAMRSLQAALRDSSGLQ